MTEYYAIRWLTNAHFISVPKMSSDKWGCMTGWVISSVCPCFVVSCTRPCTMHVLYHFLSISGIHVGWCEAEVNFVTLLVPSKDEILFTIWKYSLYFLIVWFWLWSMNEHRQLSNLTSLLSIDYKDIHYHSLSTFKHNFDNTRKLAYFLF